MKKLKSTIFTLFSSILLFAQAPQSINYQAIAWNANNTPRTNQTITVTFNIRALTTTGTIEFTETHTTATNEQGLFTLGIGSANQNGFKAVDWSKGPKFMQVIVDGLPAGTTQILSVPYALYAEKTNLQAGAGISVSGNTITNTGDLDNTNEIQTLSRNGNILTLSKGGGTVDLPSTGGTGTTYSAGSGISISPTNVISADLKAGEGISIVGNTITNTNTGGGGTGTTYTAGSGIKISGNTISNTGDGDTSTTNEIQQITLNGNTLTLSQNGGSVNLPTSTGGTGTTYVAGSGINITGNTISANEQQSLSLVGSKLTLTPNGGSVDLPSGDKQTLSYADGILSISGGNSLSLPSVDIVIAKEKSKHTSAVRAGSSDWRDIPEVETCTAPSTGYYLIYYGAQFLNLTTNDAAAVSVINGSNSKRAAPLHCVYGGTGNGGERGSWLMQLDKGEVLRLQMAVWGTGTSTFRVDEYEWGIIRIR